MEEFTTIKDLETPVKITRYLYFFDALFIAAYTFISYELLAPHIYSVLQPLYFVNCVLWGIFFVVPAIGNSRRRNWQNILNTIINMSFGRTYYGVGKEGTTDVR